MLYDNIRKLAVIGGFAVAAVVALYLFTLLGVSKQPQQSQTLMEVADQAGKTSEAAEIAAQLPEPTEQASPLPPPGFVQGLCDKYADLPDDVVPCQPALDFVIQNYGSDVSGISSFGLMAEAAGGTVTPFVAGQPIAEGTRLMWLASSHDSGAVLLDAKDLSVVKEKT